MANSWEKYGKVWKSSEKWWKVVKSGEKWGKVGKSGKNGEKWWKVAKSGEKWRKVGKSWKSGICFAKWPPAAILNDQKSLSIAFLAISDQYATFFFWFKKKKAILEVWFTPKTIGFFHYVLSMAMPNMKLIGEFVTQLEMPQAFWSFLYKLAARGHFVFPIES